MFLENESQTLSFWSALFQCVNAYVQVMCANEMSMLMTNLLSSGHTVNYSAQIIFVSDSAAFCSSNNDVKVKLFSSARHIYIFVTCFRIF